MMETFNIRFKAVRQVCSLSIILFFTLACDERFLEEKPSSSLVIPSTLKECQMLLDDVGATSLYFPTLGLLSSDEFYVEYEGWQSTSLPMVRNAYIWADDVYEGVENVQEWNQSFASIFTCNAVLEILKDIEVTPSNKKQWHDIKGAALFHRAYRYFSLAEVFTMPYNPSNADQALGLPIRRSADIDYTVARSSLKETYDFIISDLEEATKLLKDLTPSDQLNRPSKVAAYGALAKIMLVVKNYEKALSFASKALSLYSELLNYNILSWEVNQPFKENPEIVYNALMQSYDFTYPVPIVGEVFVDTLLYRSYENADLRKQLFFTTQENKKAKRNFLYSSTGIQTQPFCGISTNEIYLVQAECQARLGNLEACSTTLNMLLLNRYASGSYGQIHFHTQEEAITRVLTERRKELFFRGARWSDVRRLNVDGANIIMERVLGSTSYRLMPNSQKYAFPIPNSEVNANNKIIQNLRITN